MRFAERPDSGMDRTVLSAEHIQQRLRNALQAEVEVADTTGGGDHFRARVVAPAFEGKSSVERHRMVYAALGAEMQSGALHALELSTFTPAEWQAGGSR
jgi:stress-induced morphogen